MSQKGVWRCRCVGVVVGGWIMMIVGRGAGVGGLWVMSKCGNIG